MRTSDCLKFLLFAASLSTPSLLVQQPCFVHAQTDEESDSVRGFAPAPATGSASDAAAASHAAAVVALAFDLETTDFLSNYVLGLAATYLTERISTGDASVILRWSGMIHAAWFDAVAPYHPTAVGVYSDLGRRPEIEAETENIAVALLYNSHKILTW